MTDALVEAVRTAITPHFSSAQRAYGDDLDAARDAIAAVEAEGWVITPSDEIKSLRAALALLAGWVGILELDTPNEFTLPSNVPHLSMTMGHARAAAKALHRSDSDAPPARPKQEDVP